MPYKSEVHRDRLRRALSEYPNAELNKRKKKWCYEDGTCSTTPPGKRKRMPRPVTLPDQGGGLA